MNKTVTIEKDLKMNPPTELTKNIPLFTILYSIKDTFLRGGFNRTKKAAVSKEIRNSHSYINVNLYYFPVGINGFTKPASPEIFLVCINNLPFPVNSFTTPSPVVNPNIPEAAFILYDKVLSHATT